MTARIFILAALVLFLASAEVSAEEEFSLGEALAKIRSKELPASVEARFEHDEIIFRYKKFSANYSNFDSAHDLCYVKLNVDNEIISLLGTGADWSYGLTGIGWRGDDSTHGFAPIPTLGVGIYMAIMPKMKVYTNFSGMSLGGYGHVRDFESGVRYSPSKNFTLTAGYRHVDAKVRDGSTRGDFKTNGTFLGVRTDF